MRRPHLLPDYSVYDILSLGRADLEARAPADKAYAEATAPLQGSGGASPQGIQGSQGEAKMTFREIDAEDFVCHRCGRVFGTEDKLVEHENEL